MTNSLHLLIFQNIEMINIFTLQVVVAATLDLICGLMRYFVTFSKLQIVFELFIHIKSFLTLFACNWYLHSKRK